MISATLPYGRTHGAAEHRDRLLSEAASYDEGGGCTMKDVAVKWVAAVGIMIAVVTNPALEAQDAKSISHRTGDHCVELPASVGAGVTDSNWPNSVSTLCQRTSSFFVSIAAEGSE